MNSDDECSPKHQRDEKKKTDMNMEQEQHSQTDETSMFALLTSPGAMNNEQNCSIHSDSDNEEFSMPVKSRKSARPLEDSDSEVIPEEMTAENSQTTVSNNTEVHLHLLNTTEKEDTKWDSDCSDGQSEKCPICLSKFCGQEIGTPESCDHSFCLECLLEWEKKVNTCPVDRLPFLLILVRQKLDGKIKRRIPVSSHKSSDSWLEQDNDGDSSDVTYCEVCGHCDREDRLLLCDSCDLGYHCECLDPPLEMVPVGEWFCPGCDTNKWPEHCMLSIYSNLTEDMLADFREMLRSRFRPGSSVFQHRVIARTLASETVRHRIQRRREAQLESLRNSHDINEDATVMTSVTKRRFAHRLGLQRTTQSIIQPSSISYSDILALASASYHNDEVFYISSTDDDSDDIGYTNDKYQQSAAVAFHSNRSPASSVASSTNSRSARTQRIRVPSPPANHGSIDILNTILQTQSLLHSNSQDITIEKDGSLTLKPAGSTQQRPQNPQGRSASSDKYGSLPSASCSSKPSNNDPHIDQWYGLPSSNRQSHISDSYSGNRYDGQHSVHYASNLCDESKKKEYQHLNRTKDAKAQSEDEVDIYSDIESVGEEIMEDESSVPNNEHCNITNIYKSDLHLDTMEEDSDSSENELIIDEDAKVEEEDSHSGQWNEENFNTHSLQEDSDHNNSPLKGSDYNNFTLQEESNHGSFSPQEESNPNFSLQESSHNNSSQEESDHNDFSFKEENKSELDAMTSPCNPYQGFVNNEAVDILSQNICEPKSCDTVNSEASAEEIMDDNEVEEGDGGNEDDDELSDNYTLSNIQENEGSSDEEEQTNKTSNEESMSPNNDCIAVQSEHGISIISEQRTSFTEHDSICKTIESGEYLPKEVCVDDYNYEQETNITNIDDQINLKKGESEIFSNVTEENSICSMLNDDRSACMEEENESQESDIKSISEKEEMTTTFSRTSVSGLCIDPEIHSGDLEEPNDDERLIEHSNDTLQNSHIYEHQEDCSKLTGEHHSLMPAEDVEDISEAGSDDIKFKDGIEDWDIEVAEHADNKEVENLRDEETDERDIDVDDVEQRVAKLFADEDLSPQHGKTSSQFVKTNNNNRTFTAEHTFVNRPNAVEEEREEGEIIEEAPPKRHKSRSRKSHHRESVHHHHDDTEDYGDLAPRVNISDLPKIPKIKKDKTKVENQEMLPSSKRTSVLSRIDVGVSSEISWKRLSKSTRERSYRDGRPKDDRLLFADREIKQKTKKDEDHQRKDDDRHKEERHKRPENEKWRDKSDREHSKDRTDKQRESSRDKNEKRLEKDWRSEKSRDKKEEKEKSFDKFHREEKSHRDKHKHKHKEKDVSKDHKSDKDKSQEKEKHSYLHHSHEREHSKQKERKPKQTETKFKEVINKKEIKKEKLEKNQDRKGTKHERKRHDESHRHYEHRRKDELRYPAITAIESKEIYTKGDSIIINVNFNRSAEKELVIEDVKLLQKDIKRTKLKEKFPNEKRFEKADMKYSKQKHSSHLVDEAEISLSKQSPSERCEPKKKSTEKVQIGEMLWKETEDLTQTNDVEDGLNDDDDQLSNFKGHSSPASCISEQSEKLSGVTKEVKSKTLLSPYNDENNVSQNSALCSSPIRRSPRSPSPPSPTENDSYDPCDPTSSPFLQKGSPLSPENTLSSLEGRPVPPPSPELPPLPLEPEPITQDKSISADEELEKTSNPNSSSSDAVQVASTITSISSTSQAQISHFSLPNVKVPPPNYAQKLSSGIAIPSSNIQISSPTVPNWNSGNVQLLFATHGSQPSVQGCYIPSHLAQGTVTVSHPGAFAQAPVAAVPQTLIHSSGQPSSFMTTLPDVRVPPPTPQISLSLTQQSHTPQPAATTSSAAAKSSPDVTDVVDMEVESPYTPGDSPISSDKSVSQKQSSVLTKDKFDMLLSSLVKEHYSLPATSGSVKRHHDDARILAEKVKQSQLLSKSVISVLDKMNKKLLASKKLQQSCSSAKRSKVDSKLLDPNRSRHSRVDATKSASKKESKQEKKEVTNRTGEAQKTSVDDLPSSAVEMQVKEKFLKKLNRQERVVEEVKLCLKPYYSRREINKEEYKEIMRKSVPKVCHNRSGDINPVKIKTLIEGYIKKFKHHRKKANKLQKAKIS